MHRESSSSELHRLERLIEFEITRGHRSNSAPGWTPWAILLALATVLWITSNELLASRADIHSALRWWCLVHWTASLFSQISSRLRGRPAVPPDGPRFYAVPGALRALR